VTHDPTSELPRSEREKASRPRAIVVAVQLPSVGDAELEASLVELERLGKTLGLAPIGRIVQKRTALAAAAVLGEGKLKELAERTGGTGIVPSGAKKKKRKIDPDDEPEDVEAEAAEGDAAPDARAKVVLVDHDLTPSQARNLERATGAQVLDRTSVILSIFQRHARTREARAQVEIARLTYLAPRLRESGGGGDRQRGGIGGKGAGESALELDRRRIRDRIAELRAELERIQRDSEVRRARRVESGDTVALVGYTNAGKSSWFRDLSAGDVYVADELFATLDTTVRALAPATRPRILVSDTVGFIDRLPHGLVASFRSTLDEARDASLLVHVVDASDPAFRRQLEVTREVLAEIGASEVPSLLLLNKIDRVDAAARDALAEAYPGAMLVSARSREDVARVRERIVAAFESAMEEAVLFVPYSDGARVHRIHESARVLGEEHDDEGTRFTILAPGPVIARLRSS
jgi:GTP-binding protein HflX